MAPRLEIEPGRLLFDVKCTQQCVGRASGQKNLAINFRIKREYLFYLYERVRFPMLSNAGLQEIRTPDEFFTIDQQFVPAFLLQGCMLQLL